MLQAIDAMKIEKVVKSFIGKDIVNINPVLNQWADNKKDIFSLFGNSLTIEEEFKGELSEIDIQERFNQFIYRHDYLDYQIVNFLRRLSINEVINNRCLKDRNLEGYIKGQKLSKYLNSIIDDEPEFAKINGKDKTKREFFSIEFSMFLQSLKFEGVIVASIDPLDYLTMSLNESDWSSCHAPEGCHQSGMLSYMVDSNSVIIYVKSKKDVEYKKYDFTHNTKKWRQVAYIDTKNLSAIFSRQYPMDNDVASKEARKLIGNQFAKMYNISNKYEIMYDRDDIECMVEDCDNPLHYNDILNIERQYSAIKMIEGGNDPFIIMGNTPICVECGERELDHSEYLLCKKCSNRYRVCTCCGEEIYEDWIYYGENYYCRSCAEKELVYCSDCGRWHKKENGSVIHDHFVCNYCRRNYYSKCHKCGEYERDRYIRNLGMNYYCRSCYRILTEEILQMTKREQEQEREIQNNRLDSYFRTVDILREYPFRNDVTA